MAFATPNPFTPNTAALASEVNENFEAIAAELNAFPTDGAIKAAAIDTTQIKDKAVTKDKLADALLVTETETIASNNNDNTIPTCAAVAAHVASATEAQSFQDEGTTDITTNSDTWANMTGMSITITPRGTSVLLMFSASFGLSNEGGGYIRFSDGSNTYGQMLIENYRGYSLPVVRQYLVTGLTAGVAKTYTVQWRRKDGTFTQPGTVTPRVFTVIEM